MLESIYDCRHDRCSDQVDTLQLFTQVYPALKPEAHMNNYKSYPHGNFGPPSERAIIEVAEKTNGSAEDVLVWAKKQYPKKPDLDAFVREVLAHRGRK